MERSRGENKRVVCEKEVGNINVEKSEANTCRSMRKMKMAYTNIDGFISSKLEIKDYLRREKTFYVYSGNKTQKGNTGTWIGRRQISSVEKRQRGKEWSDDCA